MKKYTENNTNTTTDTAELLAQKIVMDGKLNAAVRIYIKNQIKSNNFREAPRSEDYPDKGYNVTMSAKVHEVTRDVDIQELLKKEPLKIGNESFRIVYIGDIGPSGQPANFLLRRTAVEDTSFDAVFDAIMAGEEINAKSLGKIDKDDDLPF